MGAVRRGRPGFPPAPEIGHGPGHHEARTAFAAPLLWGVLKFAGAPGRRGAERDRVPGPARRNGAAPARVFGAPEPGLVGGAGSLFRRRAAAGLDFLATYSSYGAPPNPIDGLSAAAGQAGPGDLRSDRRCVVAGRGPYPAAFCCR